jgi:signal transduction histidine kinase
MLSAAACMQCEQCDKCALDQGVASCIARMRQLGEAEMQEAVRGIIAGLARVARWELRDDVVVDRYGDIEIRIPDGGRECVESRLKQLSGGAGLLLATRGYLDCDPLDAGFVTNPEVVELVCFARMIRADALVVNVQPDEARRLRLLVRSAFDGTLSAQAFYDAIAGVDVSWRQLLWMMATFARCQEVTLPFADVVSARGYHHGASSVFELCWLAFLQRLGMGWRLVGLAEDRRAFVEQALVAAYLVVEARDDRTSVMRHLLAPSGQTGGPARWPRPALFEVPGRQAERRSLRMVSHDLRDLLGGIVLSATVIAKSSPGDERGTEVRLGAERIQRSAGRMARLISDLIDTASIDAGNLRLTLKRQHANLVVEEAVDMWRGQAAAKKIALEARAAADVKVAMDQERILQVLGNLITNAVKFSPTGGVVVAAVEVVGSEVRFSVKDRGVGVPADKLETIFDRFWQVRKDDRRGLGLGLHIARWIVHAHGGRIWVESEVGAGSTFLFTVPCG